MIEIVETCNHPIDRGISYTCDMDNRSSFEFIIPENVISLNATGLELDLILRMNSIPNGRQGTQAWYGDTAKSIAFALRHHFLTA